MDLMLSVCSCLYGAHAGNSIAALTSKLVGNDRCLRLASAEAVCDSTVLPATLKPAADVCSEALEDHEDGLEPWLPKGEKCRRC